MSLTVEPVACLSDNYAWLLRGSDGTVAVCDAGEPGPVVAAVDAAGGRLDWILLTHHHADHIDGVPELVRRYGAKVAGAAADAHRLPKLDAALRPCDAFTLAGSPAQIIDTPGHTRGHIVFHFPQDAILLAGDTLFSLGCGRPIEGTAEDLFHSLRALDALPPETKVCCGHEYTLDNARFCLTIEPGNAALKARAEEAKAQRAAGHPTVPTTLGQERETNVFLRAPTAARFAEIRTAKNNFR